jgi:hypothetical protein
MTTRVQARRDRRARFFAVKRAEAKTPRDRASVAYDQLRTRLADLPDGEQDAAYEHLAEVFDGLVPCEVHKPSSQRLRLQRTDTRARDRTTATRPGSRGGVA